MGIEIDQSAIIKGVIDEVSDEILRRYDTYEHDLATRVEGMVREVVEKKCDAVVSELLDKRIDEFVVQITNRYGEAKGEPVSFTEYLIGRADEYLTEHVDFQGSAVKKGSFGYKDNQTRLNHMINSSLQFHISNAMKDAVKHVMTTVAPAIAETCKLQIQQAVNDMTRKR